MSTTQSPSDDRNPTILLSATISPDTLALSTVSPTSPHIYLHLQALLTNSSTPVTILLSSSALSQDAQSFYRSYFDLTSVVTRQHPRQMKVYGILAPRITIQDPETELLTLYPGGPAETINIQIGIQTSPRDQERSADGADTRPHLAVAATPLAGLEAGQSYEVGLKDVLGEMPGYIWWWAEGEKEEIVRKLEAQKFVVSIPVGPRDGKYLCLKMIEKPIWTFVE